MGPLSSIFQSCVIFTIRLDNGLFRPFYPQFGGFRLLGPESTRFPRTRYIHSNTILEMKFPDVLGLYNPLLLLFNQGFSELMTIKYLFFGHT